MLKKLSKSLVLIISLFLISLNQVSATSGCCSRHGGVDCSKVQADGRVVCNDGNRNSSCMYSKMDECGGVAVSNTSSTKVEVPKEEKVEEQKAEPKKEVTTNKVEPTSNYYTNTKPTSSIVKEKEEPVVKEEESISDEIVKSEEVTKTENKPVIKPEKQEVSVEKESPEKTENDSSEEDAGVIPGLLTIGGAAFGIYRKIKK